MQVGLNHAARLCRGLDVGAQMNYEIPTQKTDLTVGMKASSVDKTGSFAAQWNIDKSEWKLAIGKYDPLSDVEMYTMLTYTDSQGIHLSALKFGLIKKFIGGATVTTTAGYQSLKALLEIPFGGAIPGMNQASLSYGLKYDTSSGGVQDGMRLTF